MDRKNQAAFRPDTPSFPLSMTQPGERVRIVHISGGRNLHERLVGMGVNTGDVVEVKHRQEHGAVVICMNGNRLGLGGGMALKIFVEKE
jgi:Fe2+ transport system protein FeoA